MLVAPSLLLNVLKSAADKYPGTAPVACAKEISGVAPPLDSKGADAVTPVTLPDEAATQLKFPAPSVFNTCPGLPLEFGKTQFKFPAMLLAVICK